MKIRNATSASLLIFLAWLALPAAAQIQDGGFSLRVVNAPAALSPQQTATFSFLVANNDDQSCDYEEQVTLPEGWPLLVSSEPFTIDARDSDVRLVSFQVPPFAAAGTYQVVYQVENKASHITQQAAVSVIVSPLLGLNIFAVQYPSYAIAGEDYEVTFSLQNRSNVALTLTIYCEAEMKYPVSFSPKSLFLVPGENATVNVVVKTDASLNKPTRHWVKLNVQAVGTSGENLAGEGRSWVDLIPRVSGDKNLYHLFPTALKMRVEEDDGTPSLQFEYTGKGTLQEYGKDLLEFSFVSPYFTKGEEISAEDFSFDVSYKNPSLSLYAGDRSYYLSPLTRYQSYGRGVELSLFQTNPVSIDGFFVQDWLGRNIGAISFMYAADKDKKDAVLLHGLFGEDGKIISLEGKAALGVANLETEVAKGLPDGGAARAKVSASGKAWAGSSWDAGASLLYASPLFPSSTKDMYQGSASFSLVPIQKLKVWGNYYRECARLSLPDPSLQESAQYGITWSPFGELSLSRLYWKWENLLSSSPYSYQHDMNRATYTYTWQDLQARVYYQWGSSRNAVKSTEDLASDLGTSLSYSAKTLQCDVSFVREFADDGRWSVRANVNVKPNDVFCGRLSFYYNHYNEQSAYFGGSAKAAWAFPNRGLLECLASGYYSQSTGKPIMDFSVSCSIPIQIPVSKKKNIGSLEGKIYHALDGHEGIEGVILRINGSTAVTDKDGNYLFPSLVAGNYYLEVDRSTLGIGNLPMIKVPMAITIEEHQKKQLDIEVVKAGSLRGRIAVFGPKKDGMLKNGTLNGNGNHSNGGDNGSNNGEPELVEKSAWAGITIMIKNGGETFYAVSDKNGYFSFDELLPKTWTLSILSDLPALHYLEQKTIMVTLEPGQKLELPVWKVLPVQREMILLEEEEL